MANITKSLETIKSAVYGKDMRSALHDSIKNVNDDLNTHVAKKASTSQEGHTTLSDSTSSDSSSTAATSKAVKTAYDKADTAQRGLEGEINNRTAADNNLQQRCDTLSDRITTEVSERASADSNLQKQIGDEVQTRTDETEALDERVKMVEDKAHTHGNKSSLDEITDERMQRWDSNVDFAEFKDYVTDVLGGILDDVTNLKRASGINAYDGGLFTQEATDDNTLDGGSFEDNNLETFDCGEF